MKIKFWDYLAEYDSEKNDILAAVDKVFGSGQLILGDQVEAFEREFSEFCGVTHGIGVANGTDAIFLALKALDVGPGDEVITVANTAIPTVSAIVSTGATPVFVDIDLNDYLIDVDRVEAALSSNTRCIVPVHLYGQCAAMDQIQSISEQHGIHVIEDCAQAHGALFMDARAGSIGKIAAFSFYPTKILGCYGDGGMIVCDDSKIADRLRRLRFYGTDGQYNAVEHGYNSRLDEVQAAILRNKLSRIDNYIERRKALAARYDEGLKESGIKTPQVSANRDHVFHQYVCRHPRRDQIIEAMERRGVGLKILYPVPIHRMEAYRGLGYSDRDLPHTLKASTEIFCLPIYPTLDFDTQDHVINALLEVCKNF